MVDGFAPLPSLYLTTDHQGGNRVAVTQDRLEAAISQVLAVMERRFTQVERRLTDDIMPG